MPQTRTEIAPSYMSVSAHVEQLEMSRQRFYELVADGFFLPPIFLLSTKRPAYTSSMAEHNRLAKMTGIGAVNGQPRVFYRPRRNGDNGSVTNGRRAATPRQFSSQDRCSELLAALTSLGLQGITQEEVTQAVTELFPSGTAGIQKGLINAADQN